MCASANTQKREHPRDLFITVSKENWKGQEGQEITHFYRWNCILPKRYTGILILRTCQWTVMGDEVFSDVIRLKQGHQAGSESKTTYKKGKFGGRQALRLTAEIRVMCLEATEQQRRPANHQKPRGAWNRLSVTASEGSTPETLMFTLQD